MNGRRSFTKPRLLPTLSSLPLNIKHHTPRSDLDKVKATVNLTNLYWSEHLLFNCFVNLETTSNSVVHQRYNASFLNIHHLSCSLLLFTSPLHLTFSPYLFTLPFQPITFSTYNLQSLNTQPTAFQLTTFNLFNTQPLQRPTPLHHTTSLTPQPFTTIIISEPRRTHL